MLDLFFMIIPHEDLDRIWVFIKWQSSDAKDDNNESLRSDFHQLQLMRSQQAVETRALWAKNAKTNEQEFKEFLQGLHVGISANEPRQNEEDAQATRGKPKSYARPIHDRMIDVCS